MNPNEQQANRDEIREDPRMNPEMERVDDTQEQTLSTRDLAGGGAAAKTARAKEIEERDREPSPRNE